MTSGPQRRPLTKYSVALIPCSRGKNPDGLIARTLYRGAPFSLGMRHSAMLADRTLIMSSKYGLLHPESSVSFYDAYLPSLAPGERQTLLATLRGQAELLRGLTLISYLPKAYYEALVEAAPWLDGKIARPYKSLGNITMCATLAKELKNAK